MPARHLALGRAGEKAAAEHLRRKGYAILERNWAHRRYELDIVAEKDGDLVFAEVKTRQADSLATPADAVTPAKRAKLVKAASLYLSAKGCWDRACRFDVLEVSERADGTLEVVHIENAFRADEAGGAGGSRGAGGAWQPW